MRGYKGTDKDMQCRGYQYELGKTFIHNGNVGICKSGFHFCDNRVDMFKYYPKGQGNRYFEIDATGIVQIVQDKCVSSEITFIRELTIEEVNRAYYGNGYGYGYGYDYGDGYGNGNGNGYGDGYNYGYDSIYGDSYSYGDGYGDSYGNGYGNGYGDSIQKILNFK